MGSTTRNRDSNEHSFQQPLDWRHSYDYWNGRVCDVRYFGGILDGQRNYGGQWVTGESGTSQPWNNYDGLARECCWSA